MSESQRKRVGIIGGMGPAATICLYRQITERTPVAREQDHVRLVIDSDPTTPDRTEAILARSGRGSGDSAVCPEASLIAAGRRLEAAGVDLIAIACNTAHCWYEQIAKAVSVPTLNLIDVTAEAAVARCGAGASVGLLATDATVLAALYPASLAGQGLSLMLPDADGQRQVMEGIRLVKHGQIDRAGTLLRGQAERLIADGAAGVILGCTDISVVLADGDVGAPVIDSTVALADRIVAASRAD